MKKLFLLLALFAGGFLCQTTYAQVSFRVNISSQPIWGPVGYDHVEYYYLPDMDMYYNVPRHRYIYMENGQWTSRSTLPTRYRNYDMYNARKVVVNEPRPYIHNADYRARYESSNEHANQQSIRDSHESKYFVNRNHPEHSQWRESRRNQSHQRGGEQNSERRSR
jgi:hypothetical protein